MLVALFRIGAIVASVPIVGVANNWDFIRVSGCTGVWQSDGEKEIGVETPNTDFPTRYFLYTGKVNPWACLYTTEVIFSSIVKLWHDKGDRIDIREIGILKVIFLGIVISSFLTIINSEKFKFATSCAFFVCLSDATIIPYFNSLYIDGSALVGLFFSTAILSWFFIIKEKPNKKQVFVCFIIFLWLAASKQQYSPLASMFAVICSLITWLRWRDKKITACMMICAVLSLTILGLANRSNKTMLHNAAMANSVNTFLGAVLPSAPDKIAALKTLNLPVLCEPIIGQGWFTPGFQDNLPCPQVAKVSRIRLLPLFFLQPEVFYDTMWKGLKLALPFYPKHLGIFETKSVNNAVFRWVTHTSLSQIIAEFPLNSYRWLAVFSMVFGIVSTTISFIAVVLKSESYSQSFLIGTVFSGYGGIIIFYAIASSVYGDGFSDFEKHAVGIVVGFGFQSIGVLTLLILGFLFVFRLLRLIPNVLKLGINKYFL